MLRAAGGACIVFLGIRRAGMQGVRDDRGSGHGRRRVRQDATLDLLRTIYSRWYI